MYMLRTFSAVAIVTIVAALPFPHAANCEPQSSVLIDSAADAVKQLVAEDFCAVTDKFDDKLKETLTPEKLQEGWATLIARAGDFKKQLSAEAGKMPEGFDVVLLKLEFEKSSIIVRVIFDGKHKIIGLWYQPAPALYP
jgi:hypothetical protein